MRVETYDRLKRAIDVVISATGLVITSPVQLGVAALVRARLGSPVFFRQERPGKNAEMFTLIKFRTMVEPDPGRGLIDDADRLPPVGRVLRSMSLDELPSLWNVFRGDMSLVGPRPLLPEYLPRYTPRQARRHIVRPGITGLAQINGRNHSAWSERLELDVQYVENRNLRLDANILFATILTVARRDGVTQPGHATMTKFTGDDTRDVVELP